MACYLALIMSASIQYNTCAVICCAWIQVVCRQLGYSGAIRASTNAEFGPGNGTIWMDDVTCSSSELSLDRCPFNGWGIHDCVHAEDAGVVCRGSRLICVLCCVMCILYNNNYNYIHWHDVHFVQSAYLY